jgi:hypothetical protein
VTRPLHSFSRQIGGVTVVAQAIEQLASQAGALLDIIEAYADGLRDGLSVQAAGRRSYRSRRTPTG